MTHIKRLYIDDGLSLEEVMKTMARDYNFHASKKTYKARLRKFGIKKNVSLGGQDVKYVLKLIAQAKYAEQSGLAVVDSPVKLASGQVVGVKKLASHLERKNITVENHWRRLNPADASVLLHHAATGPMPHAIDAPDVYRLPEVVFSDTARYVAAKFSAGPAFLNPETRGPNTPVAIQAHSAVDGAAGLLAEGRLEDAILLLKGVPERLQALLGNGEVEPPMTLFLIWKMIVSLIASAAVAGVEAEQVVKSLVRYTATIGAASASLSPQLRRITGALSQMSLMEGPLMFETATQAFLSMFAHHDLAMGTQGSVYSTVHLSTRKWFEVQRWMVAFEHTIWPAWQRLVELQGESSPEAIAALYSILVLERHKQGSQRNPGNQFRLAVEQTLRAVSDDWALSLAHREAYMQFAVANMPREDEGRRLFEVYMRDALETATRRQETTLHELSAMRTWLAEWVLEIETSSSKTLNF
ncbi:unnamed protein product [Discula destructiva]